MKKLTIDDNKCVSCGACLSYNEYFLEDKLGKAKVDESALLLDKDLFSLNEIISLCPTNAITISEVKIPDNIDMILSNLRDDLFKCLMEYQKKDLFIYDRDKYILTYPDSPGAFDYKYSSESKARSAGLDEFNRYVYSQYRKVILELFVQYKMDKLFPFYDLSESSHICSLLARIKTVFSNYSGQINSIYGKRILSGNLGEIDIDFEDDIINTRYRGLSEFENNSTSSGVWSDFNSSNSLSTYKYDIDTDFYEKYMGSGLFGDKHKTLYCHYGILKATKEFYKDIQWSMWAVDIDERATNDVNYFINALNRVLLREFSKRFIEIENMIDYRFEGIEELKKAAEDSRSLGDYLETLIGDINIYILGSELHLL